MKKQQKRRLPRKLQVKKQLQKKALNNVFSLGFLLTLSALFGSLTSCIDVEDEPIPTASNPPISESNSYRVEYDAGSCSQIEKNIFVTSLLNDTYLWEAEVPPVSFATFKDTREILSSLRYSTRDKWSYITTKTASDAYTQEGKYVGFGFSYKNDSEGIRTVYQVHKDSPADIAGMKRGDQFLEIEGKTYEEITDENLWGSIWGTNTIGTSVDIKFQDTDGNITEANIERDWVTIDVIEQNRVIDLDGTKVGYLVFNSFKSYVSEDLEETFAYFNDEDIDELVVDLRYNGGGSIGISRKMAALIGGDKASHNTFITYNYNDRYSHWQHSSTIYEYADALDINRVFFITTAKTCSASELLINGLKPYMDVIVIGDTTCGKPVGWHGGYDYCGLHISYPEFQMDNGEGVGGYYEGLETTCSADDDMESPLGDSEETSLNEALNYIKNGDCSVSGITKNTRTKNNNHDDDFGEDDFGEDDFGEDNFQRMIGGI